MRGLLLALLLGADGAADRDWPQWGGRDRSFTVADPGLAEAWGADGPRQLWSRPLGDGFAAVVAGGGVAYTLYRDGADDVAVALELPGGRSLWERRFPAPFEDTCSFHLGPVPRATPLLTDALLIALSAGGKVTALSRARGEIAWQRDLLEGHPEAVRACGFSSSPIAYEDLVLVQAGAPGGALVALRQQDGAVAWRRHDIPNGYSSPILVTVDGEPQLVAFMAREVVGVAPRTGELLWRHPHPTDSEVNASTPVWAPGNLLFVSSGYNGGSRVLRLTRQGGKTAVEELWAHKRMRVHFGTALRIGEVVYGSNGDFGPAPFTAVDLRSGEVLWRDRALGRASGIVVGRRLLLLDEDGTLVLATPTAQGLTVHARAVVLKHEAWTPPTLAGTTLLLRDRKTIAAYDLAPSKETR
ncbi:MAG TPA: PQQ-binding-like beta-propeller repeat protein [Vicinamibacteria bacterium]